MSLRGSDAAAVVHDGVELQQLLERQTGGGDPARAGDSVKGAYEVSGGGPKIGAPIAPNLLPTSVDEAVPTIAELPAGLDSYILLRRPDVLQAEYQLRSANANIGAARAAAIIKGRPYNGKDDLVNRKIIPENVYNGIKDRIIARQKRCGLPI